MARIRRILELFTARPVGWAVALLALLAGVPIFLRMPPWCDLTLYEVAAQTVMAGGAHYRDVFDTNPPGFVWSLIAIRRIFGDGYVIVRAIDLAIVAAIAILLSRLVRAGGGSLGVAWFAAAMALFYPFTTEFCHCQRDIWMTLPMALAVTLRVTGIERRLDRRGLFRQSLLEGAIWGLACWIKPHVLIVAGVIWLSTLKPRRQLTTVPKPVRTDFAGNFLGGLVVGLAGALWLVATGSWKPFVDIMTRWNAGYIRLVVEQSPGTIESLFGMFSTWSVLHFVGLPLALASFLPSRLEVLHFLRSGTRKSSVEWQERKSCDFRYKVLAAFYLGVMLQSCVLQRNFPYIHVPEMFLLFALIASVWPRLLALLVLFVIFSTPLAPELAKSDVKLARNWAWYQRGYYDRLPAWIECFQFPQTPAEERSLQQRLARIRDNYSAMDRVEIGEVADWLREQGVRDGDVLTWHDTPHAVLAELHLRPCFRFMHVGTSLVSERNYERMIIELHKVITSRDRQGAGPRYVVSDMLSPLASADDAPWDRRHESGPDLLPPFFTPRLRESFPYNQPAVFRSGGGHGRYIVHRIDRDFLHTDYDRDVWE